MILGIKCSLAVSYSTIFTKRKFRLSQNQWMIIIKFPYAWEIPLKQTGFFLTKLEIQMLIFCVRNLKGFLETAIGYKLTCSLHWSVWKYQCISTFFISIYYIYTPFLGLCYGFMNYILLRCQDADNLSSLKSLAIIPSQVK